MEVFIADKAIDAPDSSQDRVWTPRDVNPDDGLFSFHLFSKSREKPICSIN